MLDIGFFDEDEDEEATGPACHVGDTYIGAVFRSDEATAVDEVDEGVFDVADTEVVRNGAASIGIAGTSVSSDSG